MEEKIHKAEFYDEFRSCPSCGYSDGFHTMLKRDKEAGNIRWLFICPACHKIFDIGQTIQQQ